MTEGSEETSQDHDQIGDNGNQDTGTVETGQQGQVKQEERGGNTPVDITGPVDLAEEVFLDVDIGVWSVLERAVESGLVEGDAITRGHGEVGDEREGGDEGRDDVEETFLLDGASQLCRLSLE